ncbi:MAG: histidine phosphatase family protein [Chloroflexota bacterium]|nr:MAG: histidine phosphatase family protein [Chloroflexota bacterium]
MTLRLLLARHGQTPWNVQRRMQGFSDGDGNELDETGLEQARLLAVGMRTERLVAVYASTLRRAIQTAEPVAREHGLSVQTDPDLRELNQGELEGVTAEMLMERYSELLSVWRSQPAGVRMPGGETLEELQHRAWRAILRIVERHPEGSVLVASHNLTNHTILCKITGCHLNEFREIKQDSACLNVIEWRENGPELALANDTRHLQISEGEMGARRHQV